MKPEDAPDTRGDRGSQGADVPKLRAARAELIGQSSRYGLAGATVALVYLLTTSALASLAHLRFQAALALGFCLALSVHFTLQRRFVWAGRGEFALALPSQTLRYLATAGAQYGATAAGTALLPSILGVPVEGVYLALVVVLATINFVVFRQLVFHSRRTITSGAPDARAQRARRLSAEVSPDRARCEAAP